MNNNDILRSLRYTFDFDDSKMMYLFESAGQTVSRATVSSWLKKEDDPDFKKMEDQDIAVFLNGLIIEKRGKREGVQPVAEKKLSNNSILRKLKVALNLKNEDILDILESVGMRFGKHELSAFFRSPEQSQYRVCQDQFIRNFLHGIKLKYRKSA